MEAWPAAHSPPCDTGCPGSPSSFTGRPSRTDASTPQPALQPGHVVAYWSRSPGDATSGCTRCVTRERSGGRLQPGIAAAAIVNPAACRNVRRDVVSNLLNFGVSTVTTDAVQGGLHGHAVHALAITFPMTGDARTHRKTLNLPGPFERLDLTVTALALDADA